MVESVKKSNELKGWDEIAGYFNTSVPTVTKWHKKLGMPVDQRGRGYYANPEKLDEWSRRRTDSREEQGTSQEHDEGQEGLTARKPIRTLLTLALLIIPIALLVAWPSPGPPTQASTESTTLTMLDKRGRVAWQKDVKDVFPNAAPIRQGHYIVGDFDEDGRNEAAVTVLSSQPREETSKLICFDDDGDVLWEFVNGRELTVRGRYFEPFYQGEVPRWLESKAGSFILNIASHSTWYPSQVTLLDPRTGKTLIEYWHPGRTQAVELTDLDGDGGEELYLGGINNPGYGTGHPFLAVLPLPKPGETLPVSENFFHEGNPQEKNYLLFPRLDVFEAQEFGGNVRRIEAQGQGRLMIGLGLTLDALLNIYLNAGLEVEDIRPSGGIIQLHKKLFVDDFLDHPYHPQELEEWRKVVKFPTLQDANSPEVQRLFQ